MVVAATGFFDGVHYGHRAVLDSLKRIAAERQKGCAVITFWPHPRTVLQQDAHSLRLLNTLEEKRERILSLGIDDFHVVNFSREFSKLSTREFMEEYLIKRYNVSTLVIGYDHRLGNSSLQTQDQMRDIAASLGIETIRVDEFHCGDKMVSSTKIRGALQCGDVSGASDLLGYKYRLHGVVVSGKQLGRTIGFPTANMELYEPLKLVPGNGVYLVDVNVLGKKFKGICNIGNRPTVGENQSRTIETHILDFDEDIYGLEMSIEFVSKIRDERKFASLDELKNQITKDKESVKQY
ncbi:MAG: bifunctional riboflavin kinase/FAD synthetase [Bacteroidales bacterium]|jgi:riboflavin kinase/FMN adenylyltransferase|nr:bifunctional riboflavin kinase/FAD synthetase [Bacteroidales bacterium]MBO7763367.1 bifunctional riboflavin kinase/FAD synthetase [Bacteroidales bacterium]MBQ2243844.1 bifunctional riboflavin kinase/FAD synthetase [Bacteroidales bacterium]